MSSVRDELKHLVYDQWRYPDVRPERVADRWVKIPKIDWGWRRGAIDALLAVLVDDLPVSMGMSRHHRILNDLLAEAMDEHGYGEKHDYRFPAWKAEEAECKAKARRGSMGGDPS